MKTIEIPYPSTKEGTADLEAICGQYNGQVELGMLTFKFTGSNNQCEELSKIFA